MDPSLKHFSFQAMGSHCEIQIFSESRIEAKQLTQRLAGEIARLEKKYSRFEPRSSLSDINNSHGYKMGIKIDSETQALFNHALSCYEQSEGLFDVTAGILHHIWNFQSGIPPVQTQIDEMLPYIGFHKLSIRKSRLYLPRNMQIDFGGIVKEYAADATAKLARDLGIEQGLINLGGDFAVIGPQPGDKPWTIGVANPKEDRSLMAKVDIARGGLASSGDYERFFEYQGKRYSHILNPKTGWPSSGLRAVSVASPLCTVSGSFATIAMLKDEEDAKKFLKESNLSHVYMDSSENIGGVGLKE